MMEQEALIARVEGGDAVVELINDANGCGRCHEAGGCQSGLMGQLFRNIPRQYRLKNRFDAVVGERVIVQVADAVPLRAALLAYIVPVIFLMAGAWVASILTEGNDAATAIGAVLGLVAAIFIVRLANSANKSLSDWHPLIIRRCESNRIERESCR